MEKLNSLIQAAIKNHFSDLHIVGGHPLAFRQNGIVKFDNRFFLTPTEVDDLVRQILTPYQSNMLRNRHSVDFAMSVKSVRVRVNVFNTSRGLSIAMRLLSTKVPSIEDLNIHPSMNDLAKFKSGLVLICGPTGAGKSSTIAAVIKQINHAQPVHIISLEDPIEYRFKSDQAFIEQREMGAHYPSYERGLLDVLREDPDVIVVSELRESEAMRLTLDAAESGHLVIASMHASNVMECLYRFCNSFPLAVHELVRYQLSTTLRTVVAQQLPYVKKFGFRIPLLSILHSNTAVAGVIRDNKLSQLENIMQMGSSQGMFTFEKYQTEYLDKQLKFNPPTWRVSPTTEGDDHPYHDSPLVSSESLDAELAARDVDAIRPKERPLPGQGPQKAFPATHRKPAAPERRPAEDIAGKNFYRIEDSGSLEDVIRGLKQLDGE